MGAKIKTVKDDFPKIEKSLEGLNGKKVNVGVLGGGENAWLAGIHEYGCKIPVTDKMRAWFKGQGMPLKSSTTVITIPERSFLRAGFDEHNEAVLKKTKQLVGLVAAGKMTAEELCETVGLQLATKIKTYARNLNSPPNSGFTVERKGSNNPLVDTGDMIGAIDYEVE